MVCRCPNFWSVTYPVKIRPRQTQGPAVDCHCSRYVVSFGICCGLSRDDKKVEQIMRVFPKEMLPSVNETPATIGQIIAKLGGAIDLQEKLIALAEKEGLGCSARRFLFCYYKKPLLSGVKGLKETI